MKEENYNVIDMMPKQLTTGKTPMFKQKTNLPKYHNGHIKPFAENCN